MHYSSSILLVPALIAVLSAKPLSENKTVNHTAKPKDISKGCVFRTFFGEDPYEPFYILKTPEKVEASVNDALAWISKAQNTDGGWGAGLHSAQHVMDPHAVKSDPASTSMVAMALLRAGNTLTSGKYSPNLVRATEYLLKQVENSEEGALNITMLTGTQIQSKLGKNMDVVMTSQYLTNLLDYLIANPNMTSRVKKAVSKCVSMIQNGQNPNGSQQGAGWAGVLQSSFAAIALESAKDKGVPVDEKKLDKARDYQKKNFDDKNNTARTEDAAGILLYSVSGSARSSAKEARLAEEALKRAKREGKVAASEPVNVDNLRKAGLSENKAIQYSTAYNVNAAAKKTAQRQDVMNGFGSNGGEEFLSFLQTGESLIISKDNDWKKWYDDMTTRLMQIQNPNGSWNGHHCITSPVFCTATCLLILTINNDAEKLIGSN